MLSKFLMLKKCQTSEAFEEFPVEEEWHKGKVENLLEGFEIILNIPYEICNKISYGMISIYFLM